MKNPLCGDFSKLKAQKVRGFPSGHIIPMQSAHLLELKQVGKSSKTLGAMPDIKNIHGLQLWLLTT